MARPNLTMEEVEKLAHFGIPAASDVHMPSRWRLSLAGMPVAPMPDVGTPLFARTIILFPARLSPEMLADPQYAVNNPHWATILVDDRKARLHAFDGPRPPAKHNSRRRHEIWDGRTFEEVLAPYRAQAAGGILPAAPGGGYAELRRVEAHPGGTRRGFGAAIGRCFGGDRGGGRHGGGDRGAVRLGGADCRTMAHREARDAPESSRAHEEESSRAREEPEPALLAEYRRLAAEAGDPEDMPGYLTAIRESEMALVPPPLV